MHDKTRCPKCGNEQSGELECEACGLIFARYRRRQAKLATTAPPRGNLALFSARRLLGVATLVFCTSLITWYFTARHDAQNAPPIPRQESTTLAPGQMDETAAPPPQTANEDSGPLSAPPGDVIDNARRATVTVKTPWGTGSGFFVTDSYVVTNRHVVAARPEQIEEFRGKVADAKERIQIAEYNLSEFKRKSRFTSGSTSRMLREDAERYETQLRQAKERLTRAEENLGKMENGLQASEITVVMPDNNEYAASYMAVSDQRDLALLTLFARNEARLQAPPNGLSLRQGDTLYAIGSPSGLPQTVTKGILSGYQRYKGIGGSADQLYIQTDAAINPGNSGGPLIDDKGYVRGINTMVLRGTQGIGFAIPIEDVYNEFATILR
ncbi:MAG: trypsin-like peptidase domain-containing protein [Desulfobulbaceae bacterium]|jgi:S1-C subfamily serine protease|nr:trypsin-like peptidase domain-containing protein [Desulfobulbaceae bacterium]